MSNVTILFVGNDTVLEIRGLRDEVTGDYLNAAAVSATLVDAEGDQVTGQSWPVTLAYLPASDGVYRAILPYSLGLTAGGRYTADVSANGGAGLRASWRIPCLARARQE